MVIMQLLGSNSILRLRAQNVISFRKGDYGITKEHKGGIKWSIHSYSSEIIGMIYLLNSQKEPETCCKWYQFCFRMISGTS